MTEKQKKFIEILRQMFQLDHSDLDFGIYRIMNAKADEIREYLENGLIISIKEAFASSANEALKRELAEAEAAARGLGIDPETSPKVQELRSRLASTADSGELENEVYSHLTTFFSRYYKDGDFISLRRYKKDTYAIPYEGEEVKLYWANFDQYYIKTSEHFRDYTFKVSTGSGLIEGEEKKVHFKLVEADTETNNNKTTAGKERRFVLHEENPAEVKDGELYIYFEYKVVNNGKQNVLNKKAIETIFGLEGLDDWLLLLKTPAPTEKNKDRTLLEKHLDSYTARNTFDYFIHKDLGGFLNRELDFYIKNEMLCLDNIEGAETAQIEASLKKIKTFKTIARNIIDFLKEFEEFQKRLWLKKKFVIETDYCITLDKIDEKYYEEILANEAQLAEWKKLFDVTVETVEDLKKEPFLLLDTKFFDIDFKNRLLGEFDDLDEEIDGVLVNSENFGALNLLQKRYKDKIRAIYIDPPYNTGNDGFLYKDNYKHSSWLTMISQTINSSYPLMGDGSVFFSSCDDHEVSHFREILDSYFGSENFESQIIVQSNKRGQTYKSIAKTHEYLLVYDHDKNTHLNGLPKDIQKDEVDQYGHYELRELRNRNPKFGRFNRPNLYFPIYVSEKQFNNIGYSCISTVKSNDFTIAVYPKNSSGQDSCWRWSLDKVKTASLENDRVLIAKKTRSGDWRIFEKSRKSTKAPKSIWCDTKIINEKGTKELGNLGFKNFGFPKPVSLLELVTQIGTSPDKGIVLDYFAGSGTTGHAVINLNRPNNGKRKYILVEMGQYFDTVTKPRIQKVIYTDNWKDGKPQDKEGISQMFKYFSLESYEDTLNNLNFNRTDEQQKVIDSNPDLKEEYLLNYMLDFETEGSLLNIDAFTHPFDYKLKISTGSAGETKERTVDLVETFNYLIGLKIKTRRMIDGYLVIEGENLKEEKILVIWREGNDNNALSEFFTSLDIETDAIDLIYVNGDSTLESLKKEEDHFQVELIEETFKRQMFDAVQS